MSWIKVRKALFYFIYSIVIAIFAVELLLRFFGPVMSTGTSTGIGAKWYEMYWQPINTDGYRDQEVDLQTEKKLLLTIGDSFTAGHGVLFDETYTSLLRKNLGDTYDVVNLGYNGASTSDEKDNFKRFLQKYRKTPDVIVYQYYGNDIEGLADVDECYKFLDFSAPKGLTLSRNSYLYGIIDSLILQRKFNSCYVSALTSAYRDKQKLTIHKKEIKDFVSDMRSDDNIVILIAFPYLNDDDNLINSSAIYIAEIREEFFEFCNRGDWFYDPTSAALKLKKDERVANFMDAHPSALLHEVVSEEVGRLISDADVRLDVEGAHKCQ